MIVHKHPEALSRNINPFDNFQTYTGLWKTEGLKQAIFEVMSKASPNQPSAVYKNVLITSF